MRSRPASLLDNPAAPQAGYRIVEHEEWFYAVPEAFGPIDWSRWREVVQHPAVLAAPTRENLELLLEDFDADRLRAEALGECDSYLLYRWQGRCYGVPAALGAVDLNDPFQRNRPEILSAPSEPALRERIAARQTVRPVEFAGWLPVFRRFGNCGAHPQFNHTETPPAGFSFVRSGWVPPNPPAPIPRRPTWVRRLGTTLARVGRGIGAAALSVGMLARNTVRYGPRKVGGALASVGRLYARLRRQGCGVVPVLRFLHSRHFESQLMLPDDAPLIFFTSVPFTYGQRPWMIEVEDTTSLFFPFFHNGNTAHLQPRQLACWPVLRAMLEAPECRAIVTHMRATAESLPVLFDSPTLAGKTYHVPMGVELPPAVVDHDDDDILDLLFTNSWHQYAAGFQVRGGYEVLEAFAILRKRYPHLRLTMRTALPTLVDRHVRMIEEGWVRIITRFLSPAEMHELQRRSHIYLLPAARIHIVSVLQAMAHGQAVVASDGWGFNEYVEGERNCLVVPGREKIAWMDPSCGLLREDYSSLRKPDPAMVGRLVETVSRLVEDRALRKRLGGTARADVAERFHLRQWNEGLSRVFEQVYPRPA